MFELPNSFWWWISMFLCESKRTESSPYYSNVQRRHLRYHPRSSPSLRKCLQLRPQPLLLHGLKSRDRWSETHRTPSPISAEDPPTDSHRTAAIGYRSPPGPANVWSAENEAPATWVQVVEVSSRGTRWRSHWPRNVFLWLLGSEMAVEPVTGFCTASSAWWRCLNRLCCCCYWGNAFSRRDWRGRRMWWWLEVQFCVIKVLFFSEGNSEWRARWWVQSISRGRHVFLSWWGATEFHHLAWTFNVLTLHIHASYVVGITVSFWCFTVEFAVRYNFSRVRPWENIK